MSNIDVRDDQDSAFNPLAETTVPIQIEDATTQVQQKVEELVFEMT